MTYRKNLSVVIASLVAASSGETGTILYPAPESALMAATAEGLS
jgi:hypothetical protein